jgi:quinol monooxygenase YgiN
MMAVVAVADMFGVNGRRQELAAVLAEAERDAAGADGCVRYAFATTVADPDHVLLVSEWRDQAALDAHYASAAFERFQFALNGLLTRPSELTIHTVSSSARPLPSGPMDPRDAD